jgi:hypothetical protein
LKQAKQEKNWNAGVMFFEFHPGTAQSAVKTVKKVF